MKRSDEGDKEDKEIQRLFHRPIGVMESSRIEAIFCDRKT